jgi:hypothetical protein
MVSVSSASVSYGSVAYIAVYINLLVLAFVCHRSADINILYNISAEYTALNFSRDVFEMDKIMILSPQADILSCLI